ncbi:MAG: STAS domain-containing protein [Nitrospira sp.]|nr:STAS domain-containing protein [Nitrospira sp.]
MMNEQSVFSIRKKGTTSILDLDGKIIGSRAILIKDELYRLKESGISSVILNFENVASIDSLGIMAMQSLIKDGLSIKIINLGTACREILEQSHSDALIPIFHNEDDALGNAVTEDSSFKEKRKFNRITTNMPIEILINDNGQRGVLLNISEGGALVGYLDHISGEPHLLTHINIMMKLPFLGSLELDGVPIRFGRNSDMNTIAIQLSSAEKSRSLIDQVHKKTTHQTDLSSSVSTYEDSV